MNAVQIVTIKSLRTLFKDGIAAERIELANVEEHDFDIVVQKGLYKVGDTAVYIQPDFCLPVPKDGQSNSEAVQLFLDFTMPGGDPKKSKLGKNGRIRAIKFNFQLEGSSDPVYSFGVMVPLIDIPFDFDIEAENLDEIFEVKKWEEPETCHSGLAKGGLPSGMYSTDETNIKNVRDLEFPIQLVGTHKVDGSSITIYYQDEEHFGICSRNLEKKLDQRYIKGYETPDGKKIRKHYDKEANLHCWALEGNPEDLTVQCFLDIDPSWTPIMEEVEDSFVKNGLPILERLKNYCQEHNMKLALRGELHGQGLKGSGNKNNPHAKEKQGILFFAIDDYSSGVTRRVPLDQFYSIAGELEINTCPVILNKIFESREDLNKSCSEYFKSNLIEGIVFKTPDAKFSCKYMNPEYDAKKE